MSKKQEKLESGLMGLLRPYAGLVTLLVILTLGANGVSLVIPKLIASAIDSYTRRAFVYQNVIFEFLLAVFFIFLLSYLQSVVQTVASERVAKDMRTQLAAKLSAQSYAFVEHATAARLLTNLTSDVDAVKLFVSQAIATLVASFVTIIGASILLLLINWRLALSMLGIIPVIGITFGMVLSKVRPMFKKSQEAIDKLNRVINESILGSALIRILNTPAAEYQKFLAVNTEAKDIGLAILRLFAGLIPSITLAANLATVVILWLGGHFVIAGTMSLGEFTAFNSYLSILVFPIVMIGFMSNVIGQSTASYQRLIPLLTAPEGDEAGKAVADLRGAVAMTDVTLAFGDKLALKNVSISVAPGTSTAIIGPTAAGKTQLLYLLIGLLKPASGRITYDGIPVEDYNKESLHGQVGFVFQDSVLFNLTLRENIAFSNTAQSADLERAIATAELQDFVATLPQGLDTVVSERGTSLSGGQKQRVMLARALAVNPKVLLLDDFTARVDSTTEAAILQNIGQNYPGITLISVTQKIASVEHYDQIIVLMEGEVLATGTHQELMETSPEYVQIYNSQRSTSHYEVHA
jgi:ATP-binding cassette subfamily B protein